MIRGILIGVLVAALAAWAIVSCSEKQNTREMAQMQTWGERTDVVSASAVAGDGENAGLEVEQEQARSLRSRSKGIVGVWQGEAVGNTVQFCFRSDKTGFLATSSWAGGETHKFTWQDDGSHLMVQGKDIGGYDHDTASWRYEWMDKNLIIHLDSQTSVICSRVPETVGG